VVAVCNETLSFTIQFVSQCANESKFFRKLFNNPSALTMQMRQATRAQRYHHNCSLTGNFKIRTWSKLNSSMKSGESDRIFSTVKPVNRFIEAITLASKRVLIKLWLIGEDKINYFNNQFDRRWGKSIKIETWMERNMRTMNGVWERQRLEVWGRFEKKLGRFWKEACLKVFDGAFGGAFNGSRTTCPPFGVVLIAFCLKN
jgi:hypothetical protein